MGFLAQVPEVYQRIAKDVSFINFITPQWWSVNDQFVDSVAREFSGQPPRMMRRLLSASGEAAMSSDDGPTALVGIERYAAVANINVDTMLLNSLLLFFIILVVVTAIMSLIAWIFRKRHSVPGFLAAKGVGYAFQVCSQSLS